MYDAAASDPFANVFGSLDMSKAIQGPGGTTGPTPLDLDALLAGGPAGPNSGPSMGFTTPSQLQTSPQGLILQKCLMRLLPTPVWTSHTLLETELRD